MSTFLLVVLGTAGAVLIISFFMFLILCMCNEIVKDMTEHRNLQEWWRGRNKS